MAMWEHVKSGERRRVPSYDSIMSVITIRQSLTVQEGSRAVDSFQKLLS